MGSGPNRPNTPVVTRKKRDLSDSGGGPILDCKDHGQVPATWTAPDATSGVSGVLVADDRDVVLVLQSGAAARSSGAQAERLAACIEADFIYLGELETDDGGTFIRYWKG